MTRIPWRSEQRSPQVADDGVELDRFRSYSRAEIRPAIQRATGQAEVGFRSPQQEAALLAVINPVGLTPLVVVLPTGGGKSLLFYVPACLPDPGVTVVVVPFRALLDTQLAKAQALGIDSAEWVGGGTRRASLLFVSADRVSDSGFVGYMKLWDQQGVLRRVIVDEVHLVFKANHWRAKLAGLRQLRQTRGMLVLLTATLPPTAEEELERCMVAQYARYIRCPTSRPQTRYIVEMVPPGELIERVVALCRRTHAGLGRNRGIVYCRSRSQCEALAKEIGVPHFMGQLSDNPDRLARWLEQNGLIVATSAFGTGVDFEWVVFTLHVDVPYGMMDFAQESGRGGRGGEAVDALVLCEAGSVDRAHRQARDADQQAMANFIRTQGCWRKVMSSYLDGVAATCGPDDRARCDRCGEGFTPLARTQQREGHERHVFETAMDDIGDSCAVCWLTSAGASGRWEHGASDRFWTPAIAHIEGFWRWLRFEPDTHSCFRCGFSQKLCPTGPNHQAPCRWRGRAAPLLYTILSEEGRWEIFQQCGYGGDWEDMPACLAWLGQRHPRRIWNEVVSNGMALLIHAVHRAVDRTQPPLSLALAPISYTVSNPAVSTSERVGEDCSLPALSPSFSTPVRELDSHIFPWSTSIARHPGSIGLKRPVGDDIDEEIDDDPNRMIKREPLSDFSNTVGTKRRRVDSRPPGGLHRVPSRSITSRERPPSTMMITPRPTSPISCIEGPETLQTVGNIPRPPESPNITRDEVIDRLQRLFTQWKTGCGICRIEGHEDPGHEWEQCPRALPAFQEDVRAGYEWLGQVRWNRAWVCCYRCWAPLAICRRYQPVDARQGRDERDVLVVPRMGRDREWGRK